MSASAWTAASSPNTLTSFILSVHFISLSTWVYCLYRETCYSVHLRAWWLSPVRLHNTEKTIRLSKSSSLTCSMLEVCVGCQSQRVVRCYPQWKSLQEKQKSTEAEIGKISRVDSFGLCLFLNDDLVEMMHLEKNTATVESCTAILWACSPVTPHLWI